MSGKILVTFASKYGATKEIAEKIGAVLGEQGLDVEILPVKEVRNVTPYFAVILGSGVYAGAWRREAGAFLRAQEKNLAQKKVWLFSSGPTGEGEAEELMKGWNYPRGLKNVIDGIAPLGHGIFKGDLRESRLSGFEKWVIKKVKAPLGDFRDWESVTAWARSVASELK